MSHAIRTSVFAAFEPALAAWFAAHADHPFAVGVGRRLAYHEAPRHWPMPYAILDMPVLAARDTYTERMSLTALQVMVFAPIKTAASSLASLASDLFEGERITASGLVISRLSRGEEIPPMKANDATWQAGIQLTGYVQILQA